MDSPRDIVLPPAIRREDYQLDALCGVVNQWEAGNHATLLLMPTGTGKTITAGLVAKYALEELGRSVLFVAHRSELIDQAEHTCSKAFGFTTAIERAGESEHEFRNKHDGQKPEVLVATIQSLYEERIMERFARDRFGLIVIDEAHRSGAASYQSMLGYFQDYYLLGITATPDGATKNLSKTYSSIAYQLRLRKAIEQGYLVPIVSRTIKVPVDLRCIKTTGGDYNVGDLTERLSPAIEKLCYQVHNNIGERKTVIFTPDVGSAQMVAAMLSKMGRKSEYVAGEGGKYGISKAVRKERLERFNKGEFQVIVCCDLLVEGWDHPAISCVVIARPTRKRYKFCQMVGRGTRKCPEIGKVNCLVLDLDWLQDDSSRELCRSHTLFFEKGTSDEALQALSKRIKESAPHNGEAAKDVDILESLREIEVSLHQARQIKVNYTGKHTQLYEHLDSSPFSVGRVLDIAIRKGKDFDPYMCGVATPWQVQKLLSLGVAGADKMNLWGASRLINKLEFRNRKGLASHQQVKDMLKHGVSETQAREASKKEAAAIIAETIMKQGEFF